MAKNKPLDMDTLHIEGENGVIWNQVSNCESFGGDLDGFLKAVNLGQRSYTSIDAYVQIRKATEVFGPIGCNWGIRDIQLLAIQPINKSTKRGEVPGYQALFKGTGFWNHHGDVGSTEVMEDIFIDTSGDSLKKVTTGLITKFLSYLGWNYDVFRGRFNDVKTFESKASDEDITTLNELCKIIKKAAAEKIKAYHNNRGWLSSDVQADIKKINKALAKKEEEANAERSDEERDPPFDQVPDNEGDDKV